MSNVHSRTDCLQFDASDPLAGYRAQFVLPEGVIYLDGNSLGVLPKASIDRVRRTVELEWGQDLIRAWNSADWIEAPRRVGAKIAQLIGAHADEVVAADSTSINLFKMLVTALTLQCDKPERRVIVSDIDNFPTDLYIAQGLQELLAHRNLELRFVKRADMVAAIRDDVAVVMLTQTDYRSGERYDMKAMTALAHQHGALMLWDLCHSVAAFAVDLNGADADFAVGCSYKYLNGGPGAPAFIFAARRHLATLDAQALSAPISGWFSHEAPFAFDPKYRPVRGVDRFLVGTPPVLQLAALEASLDLWTGVDLNAVRQKSEALTALFIEQVEARCPEVTLATPREASKRGSQVSFRHAQGYAVMQALIARGVIGDFRAPDILRFGFTPLYVRYVDVFDAAQHLQEILDSREWDQPQFHAKHAVT